MGKHLEAAADMELVDLEDVTFPVMTLAGAITRPRVDGEGGCKRCQVREACERAVLDGDFALCERPIVREMFPPQFEEVRDGYEDIGVSAG